VGTDGSALGWFSCSQTTILSRIAQRRSNAALDEAALMMPRTWTASCDTSVTCRAAVWPFQCGEARTISMKALRIRSIGTA
jgi:hypothetical protein